MAGRSLSRRHWMQSSLASCGALSSCGLPDIAKLFAADDPAVVREGANRFPRMVHEAFIAEVRGIMGQRQRRLRALKTKADAEAYVADVQAKIQKCFGPWPERTPLNAKTTGVVDRDAYTIENVIFESRPQFFVTANLYIPKGLKGKAPGVVGSCGHSHNGKSHETYQSFAQGLARQGYVVLIFDPIGQGERLQMPKDDDHTKSKVGIGVGEHMMVGNQQFLIGEFFGSWRAWDGMRALDYLLSRDEVDPHHVGITGNSGGGTMSTWLCGVERRWTMGAPSCFVTGFLRNLENELPADTEQCPPGVLAEGLDHGDFLIAMAPKPVIMMGQERDYFDVRGLTDTYHDVRRVYELLGAEKNVAMFIGANDHGYHQDAREAMYQHFNKATSRGGAVVKEPELTIETDATLQCTKSGQVTELKSRPVYSFTKDTVEQLAKQRGEANSGRIRFVAASMLQDEREATTPLNVRDHYRILRPTTNAAYPLTHVATYLLDANDMPLPIYRLYPSLHYSRPPRDGKPAILYIAHDSSDVELREEPLVREVIMASPDAAFYAIDVSGLGESRPNTCGVKSYYTPYGCDYFYSSHAIMLRRSYVAMRAKDVGRAIRFLDQHHSEIHVVAIGYGTIPAAFATLMTASTKQVTLKHAPTSYADIASAETYGWPLSSFVPGVLKHFDLPDVYGELRATKKLTLVEPVGAEGPPKVAAK